MTYCVTEHVGPDSCYVHMGMTSSDIEFYKVFYSVNLSILLDTGEPCYSRGLRSGKVPRISIKRITKELWLKKCSLMAIYIKICG